VISSGPSRSATDVARSDIIANCFRMSEMSFELTLIPQSIPQFIHIDHYSCPGFTERAPLPAAVLPANRRMKPNRAVENSHLRDADYRSTE
jgi:hypothetical protein